MYGLRRSLFLAVVFVTGGAVLVIEVAATRILAPWFGNTIYTFSSVISVILAALSIGYYAGGKLADKFPSPKVFFSIIAASGLSVYMSQLLASMLLPTLGHKLSITTGPLLLSMALFFIPGTLMGMLSPWVVRLQNDINITDGVGTTAGKVFFWSTLGSISGSLLAGFVLIPHLGLDTIMLSTASLLAAMGACGFFGFGGRATGAVTLAVLAAAMAAGAVVASPPKAPGTLHESNGIYERIKVQDLLYNGRPARVLFQDRTVSGLRYMDNGETVDYVKYPPIVSLLNLDVKRALAIGGGTYILPQSLIDNFPRAIVDVAEIEPTLFDIGQKFFQVVPDPRLRNHVTDGRRFLADSHDKYDLIFTDVYYAMTIPSHFATKEYHELVRDRLTSGGVYMANLVGDLNPNAPNVLFSQMRLIREAFPNSYFFATIDPQSRNTQSIVAFAVNGESTLDLKSESIRNNPNPVLSELVNKAIDEAAINWNDYVLMTDNFAPVEYFGMASLRRELSTD